MMPPQKILGKITQAKFGLVASGDYLGLELVFSADGYGVSHLDARWPGKWTEHCQWTPEDRIKWLGKIVWRLHETLVAAKKQTVDQLPGTPVELTFDGMALKEWRVLTEVL